MNLKHRLMKEEYYTEELKKSSKNKVEAIKNQKYYTLGSIVLMLLVLTCMYFIFN